MNDIKRGISIRNKLFIVFLCLMALASCQRREKEETEIIRPVRYQQVFQTGGMRRRNFSGTARASLESKLSFKVSGTILKINVKVGDKVKAGEYIAELDPEDFRLQVQEAEASLEQAQAKARNASANYDRVRALYENRNASLNDLDSARSAYESANAAVRSIEKRLELARLQLNYTRLTAPADGAIASVKAEVNENIKAGQEVVLLTSGSKLEVSVAIPEVLIAQIEEGAECMVTFDVIPEKEFNAVVSEVGIASTGMGTTFPVTVLLKESSSLIRPGMAAQVTFLFGSEEKKERFIVPIVSVGEDRQGRFVFTVEPAEPGFGLIHRKPVVVGEITSKGIEIVQGLNDGDLVVTAGISRIHDGLRVKLLESMGE